MSIEYDELNPGQSFDALKIENARLRELLKMSSDASFEIAADIAHKSEAEIKRLRQRRNINWEAVASWLRKEAGEHLKRADVLSQARPEQSEGSLQTADMFMGLARAIEYGIETQELAEAKDRFFGVAKT